MNDFQMSSLATARSANFHDEASRQRLADSGKHHAHPSKPAPARRPLRLGLSSLVARVVA
jgi:hypothetical protein